MNATWASAGRLTATVILLAFAGSAGLAGAQAVHAIRSSSRQLR